MNPLVFEESAGFVTITQNQTPVRQTELNIYKFGISYFYTFRLTIKLVTASS